MRSESGRGITSILFPRSVAVVGASSTEGKLGHTILRNLIDAGFDGSLYPIHSSEPRILDHSAYRDLSELPEVPELVVAAIPGRAVVPILEQAADRGVGAAIVVAAGFSETGNAEGEASEQRLAEISRESGMRIVGPNCQGVVSMRGRVCAWFGPLPRQAGPGLFVSQSGGLAGTIIDLLNERRIGLVDTVVSLGNKCSVDEADLLDAAAADEGIRFAMCYVEGFHSGRGRAFVEAAGRLRQAGKPVVILKGGRSKSGGRAASSHTGSLAGSDRVFAAAMKEAGVHQARSIRDFIDVSRIFAAQPTGSGNRVLILTNLGGPGVITADLCEENGLDVPVTPEALRRTLYERIPAYCAVRNPVDLAGDPAPERYGAILEAVYASSAFDGVLIVAAPLAGSERIAADIAHAYRAQPKPTAVCWMGDRENVDIRRVLEEEGLPVFDLPEDAVGALRGLLRGTWT